MSKASLGLGIGSLLLLMVAVVVVIFALFDDVSIQDTSIWQDATALLSNPALVVASIILLLSYLLALLGLILGIFGLSQERARPTQSGRILSTIGIVLSGLPLLCCVTSVVVQIGGLASLR